MCRAAKLGESSWRPSCGTFELLQTAPLSRDVIGGGEIFFKSPCDHLLQMAVGDAGGTPDNFCISEHVNTFLKMNYRCAAVPGTHISRIPICNLATAATCAVLLSFRPARVCVASWRTHTGDEREIAIPFLNGKSTKPARSSWRTK